MKNKIERKKNRVKIKQKNVFRLNKSNKGQMMGDGRKLNQKFYC